MGSHIPHSSYLSSAYAAFSAGGGGGGGCKISIKIRNIILPITRSPLLGVYIWY